MKKKFISPKTLTIGGLCVLCIAVLVGVLYWKSAPADTFTPEADTSIGTNDIWEDSSSSLPTSSNAGNSTSNQPSDKETDEPSDDNYLVVSEDEKDVVINMTPPAEKPKAPDVPKGEKPNADNSVPDAPASGGDCIPPTPEKPPESSQPDRVYDPVFGWSDLPPAQGKPVDNDGDPNKTIGNMG